MIIRPAVVQDAFRMAELGQRLHDQSSFASMNYDADKTASYFIRLILDEGKDYYVRVVEDDNGQIVGGMVGYCLPSWFGQDRTASDITLFMLPEARGGMTAVRLIKGFIEWAKSRGAKQIRPGVSTGAVGAKAEVLYERLGLIRVGAIFCLEA